MAYLGRARKDGLKILAEELGLVVGENFKVIQITNLITQDKNYDENLAKAMLQVITDERVAREAAAAESAKMEKQQKHEMEKLQLQLECQRLSAIDPQPSTEILQEVNRSPQIDLNNFSTLLPKFDPKKEELGIFFNVFERQAKFMKLPQSSWIPYLIGTLPPDIASLIVREPEEAQEYKKIKDMLLRRFKFNGDKFRQLFALHKKDPDKTWRDFFFDISGFFL